MKPMPIFILVNNYTASAAEILAGALKIHSEKLTQEGSVLFNVFLVGTRTFGKGSVQEVIPLTNDAALKMTTALYYLPDSVSIQGKGINPDFEIEAMRPLSDETKWFNEFFGRESTLKNSIKTDNKSEEEKNNKAKPDEEKTWQERKQEQISQDYQIINTIRMIELLDCARRAMPSKLMTRKDTVEFLQKSYNPRGAIEVEEIKL
jgi:carboxyl-terminal processing protease